VLAAIALTSLLLRPAVQDSNLRKLIAHPTGQNGYEEYVQAAIILSRPENRALDDYIRWAESDHKYGSDKKPESVPEGATLLDLYRLQLRSAGAALDLVRSGSLKPVSYQNPPITFRTIDSELFYLRTACQLFRRQAYVAFAEGRSKDGAQAILDGLTLAKKIRVAGLLHYLIGVSCEAVMFAAMQRHLGQLSLADAERLQTWAESQTGDHSALERAVRQEMQSIRASLDEFFRDPGPDIYGADDPDQHSKRVAAIKSTTIKWREGVYDQLFRPLEDPYWALLDRLKQPENEWLAPLQIVDIPPADDAIVGGDPDAAKAIYDLYGKYLALHGADETEMESAQLERFRIQERLVGVYAAVIRYRRLNGRLPSTLAEVFGKEPADPGTGHAYNYQPNPDGSYRVTCLAPMLGVVDLVYKSPKPGEFELPPPLRS